MEYVYRTTEQRVDKGQAVPPTTDLPWEVANVSYNRRRPPRNWEGRDFESLVVVWRVPKAAVELAKARREAVLTELVHRAVGYAIGALALKVNYPKKADKIKTRFDEMIKHIYPQDNPEQWGLGLIQNFQAELRHLCPESRPLDTPEDREDLLQELLAKVIFPPSQKAKPTK